MPSARVGTELGGLIRWDGPQGTLRGTTGMTSDIVTSFTQDKKGALYFGTVGNNAPFIGLLGTVIGIIVAFRELGANPKGGLEVVGPGIAEALVATAVGLLVAIPAVVIFNVLKGQVKTRVGNTDFLGRIVMAWIQEGSANQDSIEAEEG